MNKPHTADQALVRRLNVSIVMDCIRFFAPLSRAELAVKTGLNRSTVSSIVDELIDQGYIHEIATEEHKLGRPGMPVQINPDAGCAVGVEIGVDFLSVILTNFLAKIIWRQHVAIDPRDEQIAIMERAEEIITEAMAFGEEHALRPLGIGVAVPGLVDANQGKLVYAPNLNWIDMPIRLIWMRRFNLPVFVENEANCAALGEYFYGMAHDVKNFIFLRTGIGLGGGIMIGGHLFRGTQGYGGEVGHISIHDGGETCGCGRVGCWETFVSPPAILRRLRASLLSGTTSLITNLVDNDLDALTIDTVVEAAQKEDPLAVQCIMDVGNHLAIGIANLVNIFNPELVVLGGALTPFGLWVIPTIKSYMQKNILFPLRDSIQVEISANGEDACALGTVALVLDDILREPMYSL